MFVKKTVSFKYCIFSLQKYQIKLFRLHFYQ